MQQTGKLARCVGGVKDVAICGQGCCFDGWMHGLVAAILVGAEQAGAENCGARRHKQFPAGSGWLVQRRRQGRRLRRCS